MTTNIIRIINLKTRVIYRAKRLGFTFHDTPCGLILRLDGRIKFLIHSYPEMDQLLDELAKETK